MQSTLCNKWSCAAFPIIQWAYTVGHQAAHSGIILLLQTLRNHHVIIILSKASINKYIWDRLSHFGGRKPHCGGRIKYFCLHFLLPLQNDQILWLLVQRLQASYMIRIKVTPASSRGDAWPRQRDPSNSRRRVCFSCSLALTLNVEMWQPPVGRCDLWCLEVELVTVWTGAAKGPRPSLSP